MRPLRVLHVIDTLEVGGAEKSLIDLLAHFDPTRVHSTIVTVYGAGPFVDECRRRGWTVYTLNIGHKYGFWQAAVQIGRLLHEGRYDLVHASLFRSSQAARLAGFHRGIPSLSSWTSIPYGKARRTAESDGLWKRRILQLFDIWTSQIGTHFHAVSWNVAKENARHLCVSLGRVSVVYRGRPIRGQDIVRDRSEQTQCHRPGGGGPILLSVGRLVTAKNHAVLVRAMPQLLTAFPQLELWLVGDGPERARLQHAVESHGLQNHVRFLGYQSEIGSLLDVADVFVFPSFYEGLPGAVVEAMLARRPIVASNIAAHVEFLRHGEHALLCSPHNSDCWAQHILTLLNNQSLASQLAQAAYERACGWFDIRTVARQMEELYFRVAGHAMPIRPSHIPIAGWPRAT